MVIIEVMVPAKILAGDACQSLLLRHRGGSPSLPGSLPKGTMYLLGFRVPLRVPLRVPKYRSSRM